MELACVVGGQWGSEGKGAVVGRLARYFMPNDLVIRVAGPNAGHTVYDLEGQQFKLRQVPAGAVISGAPALAIAAGSEVDLAVLAAEVAMLEQAGHPVGHRLRVHPSATVVRAGDVETEAQRRLTDRIGSTGKGVGAARAARIMRTALTIRDVEDEYTDAMALAGVKGVPAIGTTEWRERDRVIVEGTQGFGLGLHTDFYPYATSSDCRAIDFLAMAGISPWDRAISRLSVWVTLRVYPIRVAGNSGPMRGETTWEKLDLPQELTTVTGKVRRVAHWDSALARAAVLANGGHPVVGVALTMLDQRFKELSEQTGPLHKDGHPKAWEFVRNIEHEVGASVRLVGTGPQTMAKFDSGG